LLNGTDCLGIVLAWTRTRGSVYSLQLMFGMTQTPLGMYLRVGRRIVIEALKYSPYAAIKLPCEEKIVEYKRHIQARYLLLENVWCTMYGLKLTLQKIFKQ
jgi:hypothetical protein